MNFDYDVVVGAWPVGSTISYFLAQNGLDVAIVEKKKQISYPLQCAGILSRHIFETNELPDEVIVNAVRGAFLHTKNHILNVEKQEYVAYIIDRIAYGQFLLNRAVENDQYRIGLFSNQSHKHQGKFLKDFLNDNFDYDLDYLFQKLGENDCEKLISEYGDMDNQSVLVKEFIKRGLIFKIVPTFLFKKVVNIFGFR